MLFEMFVIGTFWFWALVLFEFCFLIYLLERERYVAAPFSVLGCVALVVFCGSGLGDIAKWVIAHPLYSIGIAVGYFLVGALFTATPHLGKWAWFVRNVRDENREMKKEWLGGWKNRMAGVLVQVNEQQQRIANAQGGSRNWSDAEIENMKQELSKLQEFASALGNCNGAMTENLLPFWKEYEETASCYDFFGRRISIKKPEPENFKGRIIAWIVYWPPVMFWTLLNDPLRHIGRMIYDAVAGILKGISDSAWKDEDKI